MRGCWLAKREIESEWYRCSVGLSKIIKTCRKKKSAHPPGHEKKKESSNLPKEEIIIYKIVHPFVNHLNPTNQTRNGKHKEHPKQTRQGGAVDEPAMHDHKCEPGVPVIVQLLDPVDDEHEA